MNYRHPHANAHYTKRSLISLSNFAMTVSNLIRTVNFAGPALFCFRKTFTSLSEIPPLSPKRIVRNKYPSYLGGQGAMGVPKLIFYATV